MYSTLCVLFSAEERNVQCTYLLGISSTVLSRVKLGEQAE